MDFGMYSFVIYRQATTTLVSHELFTANAGMQIHQNRPVSEMELP